MASFSTTLHRKCMLQSHVALNITIIIMIRLRLKFSGMGGVGQLSPGHGHSIDTDNDNEYTMSMTKTKTTMGRTRLVRMIWIILHQSFQHPWSSLVIRI